MADSCSTERLAQRIVLEGLPGAGKTTLLGALSRAFDLPIIPEWVAFTDAEWKARPLVRPFYFCNDELKECLAGLARGPVLLDRHYAGALAFGYALTHALGETRPDGEGHTANMEWYRESAERGRLSRPAVVLVLDVTPSTSRRRQPRAARFDPVFGDDACLAAMRQFYRWFYETVETDVRCVFIDAEADADRVLATASDVLRSVLEQHEEVGQRAL